MMRVSIVFLAFFFTTIAFGQHEGDYWFFGQEAGVHFNEGEPEVLLNGALSTQEGCAVISTPDTGELLFYTDGSTVYNKNNEVMLNGTGLNGDPSTTQAAVIVPKPGSNSRYYIFTVDDGGGPNGLQYSEVDMNLDEGLGGVNANKNILLHSPVDEKLTAVKNTSSDGYWVVVHAVQTQDFYSYAVLSTGVDTVPVISTIENPDIEGLSPAVGGAMKISPNGEKIAICNIQHQLYDFNASTGKITNPIVLYDAIETGDFTQIPYGVEFSSNSKVLYFNNYSSSIFQFNLQAGSSDEDVISSKVEFQSIGFGSLQLGPNEKIYLNSNNYLSVINSPKNIGIDCDFQENAVDLQGRHSVIGLPNFVQSFFEINTFTYINTCFGQATSFFLANELSDVESINWNFDDPASGTNNTSTEESPTHVFSAPGIYNVVVEITINGNTSSYSNSVTIYEQPLANPVDDMLACDDDNDGFYNFDLTTQTPVILNGQDPNVFSVEYYSSQENFDSDNPIATPANFQNDTAFTSQTIFVKVKNNLNTACEASTSFSIEIFDTPILNSSPPRLTTCSDPSISTPNVFFAEFDLTEEEENLLDGQSPTNFIFHYYTDAALSDEIGSPGNYENTTSPQTIYVTVENSENTNCMKQTSFELEVFETPIASSHITLQACGLGDGSAEFDMSNLENEILNGQTGFSFSYLNADGDTLSSLPNPFVSESQTLIVLIKNPQHPACFAETTLHLIVRENPDLTLPSSTFICNDTPIELTADPGYDSYVWSTGEASQTITVSETGDYEVTATTNYDDFICETSKTVHVSVSEKAEIITIDIEDWTAQNNSITVEVNGEGDYLYSLDDVQYQESNQFFNLEYSKDYTVYVKDKNGCGIATQAVYLLYYPKFLTPNHDGINDTWQIFNSHREPELKIYIFDRFGKLLTKINPRSRGWDGTYHGKAMPSNDYWFLVERKNGKRYTGHFTLKR
ncbi:MAG: T9SS type B sorting domain-containing protein [Mesonia sp.]|uniref:T9SS type B sorting domain-containing protein n=1 Tax=Mesonia sp. TaxID=1960830 RepID=UPI003F9827F5